jgi:hypothetical protein
MNIGFSRGSTGKPSRSTDHPARQAGVRRLRSLTEFDHDLIRDRTGPAYAAQMV